MAEASPRRKIDPDRREAEDPPPVLTGRIAEVEACCLVHTGRITEEEACHPVDTRQPVDTEAEAEAEAEAAHPLPGCLRKCWT